MSPNDDRSRDGAAFASGDSGSWERVKDLFGAALELPEADRELFVWTRADSEAIAQEVLALLAAAPADDADETAGFDLVRMGRALAAAEPPDGIDRGRLFDATDGPDGSERAGASLVGSIVGGRYRIDGVLGSGGMGAVFAATHVHNGKKVAVKVLHGGFAFHPDMRDRFVREAHVLAALEHPNVVEIYDSGAGEDGSVFIVMALLEGRTLRERLDRDGPLPPDQAVDIARQTLDALGAAHERGIVHRDVKPPNIFLLEDTSRLRVKVLDFGIAQVEDADLAAERLTRDGQVPGTPQYMSPEQLASRPLDGRSDIYSIGAVLYEMLSGHPPFDDRDFLALAAHVMRRDPVPLASRGGAVSRALSDATLRLLEKDSADRYQTACSAARALARAVGARDGFGGDWDASGPDELSPASRRRLRRRVGVAVAATVAGVVLAAAAWLALRPPVVEDAAAPLSAEKQTRAAALARFDREFVRVPGGEAIIGLDPEGAAGEPSIAPEPDEIPAHSVMLDPYAIAIHEVTRADYAAFVAATSRPAPDAWGGPQPAPGTGNLPVTEVSWNDATEYAEWRSSRDRIRYRLPSEAEWEFAARGTQRRIFPWGDSWDPARAYADQAVDGPMPVDGDPTGTADRSPFGVTGMAGNVSEWTADAFGLYPRSPYRAKAGDRDAVIVRGGRFNAKPGTCRTTYRQWLPPSTKDKRVGFRLAAELPER